jgi:hypothetical protein
MTMTITMTQSQAEDLAAEMLDRDVRAAEHREGLMAGSLDCGYVWTDALSVAREMGMDVGCSDEDDDGAWFDRVAAAYRIAAAAWVAERTEAE